MLTGGDTCTPMATPAAIHITDLLVRCILGVTDEERREQQDVLINLQVTTDISAAAAGDDLAQALDYRALKKRVFAFVAQSQCHLLETLVARVAKLCLEDPRAASVTVRIEKPSALRFARSVAIEMTVSREELTGP